MKTYKYKDGSKIEMELLERAYLLGEIQGQRNAKHIYRTTYPEVEPSKGAKMTAAKLLSDNSD